MEKQLAGACSGRMGYLEPYNGYAVIVDVCLLMELILKFRVLYLWENTLVLVSSYDLSMKQLGYIHLGANWCD